MPHLGFPKELFPFGVPGLVRCGWDWCHLLVRPRTLKWNVQEGSMQGSILQSLLFVPPLISVGWFSFNFCITSLMFFGFPKLSITRFQVCSDCFCDHLICSQSPLSVTEIQSRKVDAFPNRWVTRKMSESSKGDGSTPSWWIPWANKALFVTLSDKDNLGCVFCSVQEIRGGWSHLAEFGCLLFIQYLLFVTHILTERKEVF